MFLHFHVYTDLQAVEGQRDYKGNKRDGTTFGALAPSGQLLAKCAKEHRAARFFVPDFARYLRNQCARHSQNTCARWCVVLYLSVAERNGSYTERELARRTDGHVVRYSFDVFDKLGKTG